MKYIFQIIVYLNERAIYPQGQRHGPVKIKLIDGYS
jgi:hypothetical protein